MTNLANEFHDVHEHFMNGGFAVHLDGNNPFSKIPVDQATEETVNKDTKIPVCVWRSTS